MDDYLAPDVPQSQSIAQAESYALVKDHHTVFIVEKGVREVISHEERK